MIIGIGDEDFSQMEVLDADSKILTDSNGRSAARDIIQFVRFQELAELSKRDVSNIIM